MAYQLYFDGVDVVERYNLLCTEVTFGTPTANLPSRIQVMGKSGGIDITDIFGVSYTDREFFAVMEVQNNYANFETLKSQLISEFEGKKVWISDNFNQNKHIVGRIVVNATKEMINATTIELSAIADPWWYDDDVTVVDCTTETQSDFVLQNKKKSVSPVIFTTDNDMQIEFNGLRKNVVPNIENYIDPEIVLQEGDNTMTVIGAGTVRFTYRQGAL